MIRQHLYSAILSLWSNKLRSGLSMLGVVIGVSLLLCLVSLGQGVKNQVVGQINTLGSDLLYVVSAKKFILSNFDAATLTQQDLESAKNTPDIIDAAPVRYTAGVVSADGRSTDPNLVVATTNNYAALRDSKIERGDFFSKSDDESGNNVAVIGPETERILFGEGQGLGKTVIYNKKSFTVSGVFAPATPGSELTIGGGYDNVLFIPIGTYQSMSGINGKMISVILTKINPSANNEKTKQSLTSAILKNHQNNQNFSVIANDELLQTSSYIVDILTKLILIITTASLLVGGIGIMNIMLVSIDERTNEIGIRKSMGASPGNILLQFLTESTILSILGGIIGTLLAVLLTSIAGNVFTIKPYYSPLLFIFGFSLSVIIGIVFGITPAIRASKKSPINAIRSR